MIEVRRYIDRRGRDVVGEWLNGLESKAVARVSERIDRLSLGNFGDCKSLRSGVSELRVDWGPGYRLYYGDKRKQSSDIERAIEYLEDYKGRMREP